jgi:hypothetical protein
MNDNPKILYKFPSRSRPNKFFKALDNIHDLSTHDNFEILATLDVDDQTMCNPEVNARIKSYPKVNALYGTSTGKIHACNRDLGLTNDWDIVVLMSDDQVFLVKGFDTMIVEAMQKYFPDTDGVLHWPDSFGKHELSVLAVMGKKYFDRFNYIYHPSYSSVYADNEYTWISIMLNKHVFIPKRIFDHHHPAYFMAEKDALYARNESPILYQQDNMNYVRRKERNFDIY